MTIANLIIIVNIFILESLLSIDNAAVLAIMVKDLPVSQRLKALRYGIGGAFLFRGLCLFIATWLIKILWLKIAGGIYLLYLVYGHFYSKGDSDDEIDKSKSKVYIKMKNSIGIFISTIILVEIMDIAFSIDNIFAVVAMTDNFILIIIGVCMGIISMRFVASFFTILIQKYPSLENSAFIVIFLLAIKLIISGIIDYSDSFHSLKIIMSNNYFNFGFSGLMIIIFFVPIFLKLHYENRTNKD